ncbi:endonuclease domain-containing protein [Nonomuraea sp. ATR24]|uniref:endonuclease domain-containing protein n=1 Tax=Nonomuraea sp. ATR24 TaxID=1676744 RepID=UPI0035BFAD85
MVRSWSRSPAGRVVWAGADPDAIELAADPLPEDGPAIVTYTARPARTAADLVAAVLDELDAAALALFPAWLPAAATLDGPGGAAPAAVRALALREAATSPHFGPFLAALATRALATRALATHTPVSAPGLVPGSAPGFGPLPGTGPTPTFDQDQDQDQGEGRGQGAARDQAGARGQGGGGSRDQGWGQNRGRGRGRGRFGPEARAAGLARVLAASFRREWTAILVRVPGELPPAEQEVLVAGCEWLAHRGGFGVWLAGAPLPAVDRVPAVPLPLRPLRLPAVHTLPGERVRIPTDQAESVRPAGWTPDDPRPPHGEAEGGGLGYPPVAGRPHPASRSEQALEDALAPRPWAAGRAWNRTYQPHPLAPPIRVDLLWQAERCVVEIDGPDHRRPAKFADDRRRDVLLQLAGYAVLRFTDSHVLTDPGSVARQIELFLRSRRGTTEG